MNRRHAPRTGFTLIEVITAIALTAIVTGIASAAIASASDARATVLSHQRTLDAESRWRVLLSDMLRHAPPADAADEPLLRIERAGEGGDRLVFLSRGVVQPFGTGRVWRVTISSAADGVELFAEAIGRGERLVPLRATLPHRARFEVAVLEGTDGWRTDWPVQRSRPSLLRLTFAESAGEARAVAPLIVNLAPLASAAASPYGASIP